jgi:metal-responsive CopG/Arc/MetJ family transcriptional regulator
MSSEPENIARLQIVLPLDELKAIDDFRFRNRMPNRSAAVRELLRRGVATTNKPPSKKKY